MAVSASPWIGRALVLIALACPMASMAQQDEPANFFRGRQITIAIASSPGGGYDSYGRLVARHIVKHIPGNPGSVVTNMTGAGGHLVGRHRLVRRGEPPRRHDIAGAARADAVTVTGWRCGALR